MVDLSGMLGPDSPSFRRTFSHLAALQDRLHEMPADCIRLEPRGPDPARGIFPTLVVATSEGTAVVTDDEIRAAYERIVAEQANRSGSGNGGAP